VAEALKEFDTSKNFDVTYDIDPAILGGLQLFFPTAFMDLSLKTRIDRLEDECSGIGL
jgi:F0F1-type ATP synthase delta subunit